MKNPHIEIETPSHALRSMQLENIHLNERQQFQRVTKPSSVILPMLGCAYVSCALKVGRPTSGSVGFFRRTFSERFLTSCGCASHSCNKSTTITTVCLARGAVPKRVHAAPPDNSVLFLRASLYTRVRLVCVMCCCVVV